MTLGKRRFELTEDLVKLLRRSYVSRELTYCEYGAAEIDPKRPYGNSDVASDIAEILGWPAGELTSEQEARAREIHEQTPTALQIVLRTGSFDPGIYEAAAYSENWQRVS